MDETIRKTPDVAGKIGASEEIGKASQRAVSTGRRITSPQ
jgi:hypothetical protein